GPPPSPRAPRTERPRRRRSRRPRCDRAVPGRPGTPAQSPRVTRSARTRGWPSYPVLERPDARVEQVLALEHEPVDLDRGDGTDARFPRTLACLLESLDDRRERDPFQDGGGV